MGNIIPIEGGRAPVKASTAHPLTTFEGYLRTWRNAAKSTVTRYRSGLRYLERVNAYASVPWKQKVEAMEKLSYWGS